MAEEPNTQAIRLMNFVSEEQLAEAKKTRGERVEDGSAQRDRPLYEILRENKDKKDAEFNERFKHRPPKALDDDETEFLDKLEMSRREYERQMRDEEAQELQSFQAAVAARSNIVHELEEAKPPPPVEEKQVSKKNPASQPLNMIIKVKPQAKKAKPNPQRSEEEEKKPSEVDRDKSSLEPVAANGSDEPLSSALTGLVSYSDESDED
ncbi:PSME3-interacting protein [Punica granatum]|uniref:Uncharacterized protein n=2 Tax=Punica granatum TaxID=22663 RepID=A0A2I0KJG4_PUNGR|nr:PSME3-interacting protein [Punica granatum]PKI68655.1 hypothetical protein CRG98_010935 [Punica granatum]